MCKETAKKRIMLMAWYRRYQGHNLNPLIFLASCYDGKPDDFFEEDLPSSSILLPINLEGVTRLKPLINESS
jgi:hypothetical protein